MRGQLLILLFCVLHQTASAQNTGHILLQNAKFITGDDRTWSKPDLNDNDWKDIKTGQVWQSQGYPQYHGYAWYRIHVVIPSSLKNNALWKDSLRLYLAHVNDVDEIPEAFETFMSEEKQLALQQLSDEEKLSPEKLNEVIGNYIFTERRPLPDDTVNMMEVKPKILERKSVVQRITDKILGFVETFINGMGT